VRARRPGRRQRSVLFPTNAASHRSTRKILWKATISRVVGSVYVAPVLRAGQARACTYSVGLKADATKTFRAGLSHKLLTSELINECGASFSACSPSASIGEGVGSGEVGFPRQSSVTSARNE